jgi:hypothetical protein
VGYPHSIPVNQIPFKYYNGNQSVGISKLQGLQVTCNPHKFKIPALRFPYKDPVNTCKHLQCSLLFLCLGRSIVRDKPHFHFLVTILVCLKALRQCTLHVFFIFESYLFSSLNSLFLCLGRSIVRDKPHFHFLVTILKAL